MSRGARRARAAKALLTRETQSGLGVSLVMIPEGQGGEGSKPHVRQGNVQVSPARSLKAATDDDSALTLQLTEEPLTSSVHIRSAPMQAYFTLTDINV